MHPDLRPFSIEEILDGMKVRKITRMYWDAYPTPLTVRIDGDVVNLVDEEIGEIEDSLTPENFVHAVQYMGLIVIRET